MRGGHVTILKQRRTFIMKLSRMNCPLDGLLGTQQSSQDRDVVPLYGGIILSGRASHMLHLLNVQPDQ